MIPGTSSAWRGISRGNPSMQFFRIVQCRGFHIASTLGVRSLRRVKPAEIRATTASASGQAMADLHMRKWQLLSAVCVERPPVVSAARTPMEEEWAQFLTLQELEQSLLSDHEVKKLVDAKRSKMKEKGLESDEIVMETAQDLEDNWNEQLARFKPLMKTAPPVEKCDSKSLQRKLDRKLYLAGNQTLGASPQWIFPQGAWRTGESLKETAERVLKSTMGENLHVSFLGAVPCGFYKYKYPVESEIANEFYGAKVFFFKALLDVKKSKEIIPSGDITDYKWLTREELEQTFVERYYDRIERFLYEFHGGVVPVDAEHHDMVQLHY